MLRNAWIIPLLPTVSFVLILFFGKRLPRKGSEIGVALLGVALVCSLFAATQWIQRPATVPVTHHSETAAHSTGDKSEKHEEHEAKPAATAETAATEHEKKRAPVETSTTWFEIGDIKINLGTYVDGLSIALLVVVSLISFLVHVFSTSYMHDDRRYTYYFAALSLFTAGMLLLVISGSTLQMLFGWELMGVCSFMLIGHWWEEPKNSNAALKAFFTTRTGDIGFLVGLSIIFFAAGNTFDVGTINEMALAGEIKQGFLLAAAAAFFWAVIGKSAQFPLHTWLPDAMAGPTPVSALIHAATMVVAGVFLVARLYGVFWEGFHIGDGGVNPIALIGGITILIAALLAFVQTDIKKVLAYSTVSQLGYMVMALGVGAWTAGVFHLFTHAFFKALLFLGAGSVSHAVHSFDMKEDMGGLRKHMPTTYKTFLIGTGALAGIFPLAGFWSKDEILLGAGENGYALFMVVGLVGAALTAAYMTRCVYLTFFGEYRGHAHPHESPKVITIPLMVLAALSIVAGLLNAEPFGLSKFTDWVEPAFVAGVVTHHEFSWLTAGISTAAAVLGILVARAYCLRTYGAHASKATPNNLGYRLLANRYYLDHLYTGVIVRAIKGPVAQGIYWFDQKIINGFVNGVAWVCRQIARFVYSVIDQRVVDGAVNGSGLMAEGGGSALRVFQNGRVQSYAAMFFGAAALFGLAVVIWT